MNISISELLKLNNVSIIDIRSTEKYNNNHIPNSKNMPCDLLINNPSKYLSKNQKYFIYCQKGIKSVRMCNLLNSLGYCTVNVIGGYESWILEK